LLLVGNVLVVASAAALEVWTLRRDALRRSLKNRFQARPGKTRLLLGQVGFDLLAGQHEGNEDGFAASALVGGKAGKAIAAVDQFFDGKQQGNC